MSLFHSSHFIFTPGTITEGDRQQLDDFDALLSRPREIVSTDRQSAIGHFQLDQQYYLKIYTRGNGRLRDLVRYSRFDRELSNLRLFAALGIPTPAIIAHGRRAHFGRLQCGLILTKGLSNAPTLMQWGAGGRLYQQGRPWLHNVLRQLAKHTRRLHQQGFVHVDLKWRNLLLTDDDSSTLYFIDCPSGYKPPRWVLERLIVKDLACIDREASQYLTPRDRLYLYKQYSGNDKLTACDKKRIHRVLKFFSGYDREQKFGKIKQQILR